MNDNIIFVGGIHGVGKGTICKELSESFSLTHLSASEVLKWEQISDKNNKRVYDIDSTQERLICGLSKLIKLDENYLLDGHFCLLNLKGYPEKVSENTFKKINPSAIIVINCDEEIVLSRLEKRDKIKYSIEILTEMQKLEINYAYEISEKLNIPFFNIKTSENNSLKEFLANYESTN